MGGGEGSAGIRNFCGCIDIRFLGCGISGEGRLFHRCTVRLEERPSRDQLLLGRSRSLVLHFQLVHHLLYVGNLLGKLLCRSFFAP